jgi:hypothetical protein
MEGGGEGEMASSLGSSNLGRAAKYRGLIRFRKARDPIPTLEVGKLPH